MREVEPNYSLDDMEEKKLNPADLYSRCNTLGMSSLSSDILAGDQNVITEEDSEESDD